MLQCYLITPSAGRLVRSEPLSFSNIIKCMIFLKVRYDGVASSGGPNYEVGSTVAHQIGSSSPFKSIRKMPFCINLTFFGWCAEASNLVSDTCCETCSSEEVVFESWAIWIACRMALPMVTDGASEKSRLNLAW